MMSSGSSENRSKKYELDMCSGPLIPKLLIFSIPLVLSGILQLLFNAADMIVVGNYSTEKHALAAIGATSALVNFFVNISIGISIGSNVVVARYFGAKKDKEVHEAVHTSILIGLVLGIITALVAILTAKPILILMDTPAEDNVLTMAVLYVRIYFAGLPVMMLYNFGSAILRAIGDTKRPLIYLTISGVLNILLNLLFVIVLGMDVDGVALATVISQALSAYLVLRCLAKSTGSYRLNLKELKFHPWIFKKILQIGLPAGVQGMIFSFSNILIQSSVNYFGPVAMSGNTACSSIEAFVYTAMNCIYQTALSFTSQNYGGGKYGRINKILISCLVIVSVVGLGLGNLVYLFGRELLGLYTPDPDIIAYGLERMKIICTVYFTCGIMDVLVGVIRGLGYGILPMVVSLIGACGLRIVWIYTVFQHYHTLEMLYISYPVTWVITSIVHVICFVIIRRRLPAS